MSAFGSSSYPNVWRRSWLCRRRHNYDLRHTCAALLVAQGAHPKAIQEIPGHESITMTLDQYGHLLPGLGDDLAARLDAAHVAAGEPPSNVVTLNG